VPADKRIVTLDLAGAKYRLSSDAEDGHLQRLVQMVDERIAALGPKSSRSSSQAHLLAVVALGLADELLAAERRARALEDSTRKAVSTALERIDRRLADEPRD
jgi:cell division protein ZapA (FtsZ GTPase activity inhibitor)